MWPSVVEHRFVAKTINNRRFAVFSGFCTFAREGAHESGVVLKLNAQQGFLHHLGSDSGHCHLIEIYAVENLYYR